MFVQQIGIGVGGTARGLGEGQESVREEAA